MVRVCAARTCSSANVWNCALPETATREPEEIQTCTPFLREQTRTIDPEVLVTLGKFSTQFVLKTQMGITRLHGRVQRAGKFLVFPIFHPPPRSTMAQSVRPWKTTS